MIDFYLVPDSTSTFLQCFYIFEPDAKDSSKIETSPKNQIVIVHPSEGIYYLSSDEIKRKNNRFNFLQKSE